MGRGLRVRVGIGPETEGGRRARVDGTLRVGDGGMSIGARMWQGPSTVTCAPAPCLAQVANKVSELLLMRQGVDVCCTSAADAERFERFGGAGGTVSPKI